MVEERIRTRRLGAPPRADGSDWRSSVVDRVPTSPPSRQRNSPRLSERNRMQRRPKIGDNPHPIPLLDRIPTPLPPQGLIPLLPSPSFTTSKPLLFQFSRSSASLACGRLLPTPPISADPLHSLPSSPHRPRSCLRKRFTNLPSNESSSSNRVLPPPSLPSPSSPSRHPFRVAQREASSPAEIGIRIRNRRNWVSRNCCMECRYSIGIRIRGSGRTNAVLRGRIRRSRKHFIRYYRSHIIPLCTFCTPPLYVINKEIKCMPHHPPSRRFIAREFDCTRLASLVTNFR